MWNLIIKSGGLIACSTGRSGLKLQREIVMDEETRLKQE